MRFISESRGQYLPEPTKSSNETPMSAFGGKADITVDWFDVR
jgi:hypothetical protein